MLGGLVIIIICQRPPDCSLDASRHARTDKSSSANCSRVMSSVRTCDGSLFQTAGAEMKIEETPRSVSLHIGPVLDQITVICRTEPGTRSNRCFYWMAIITYISRTRAAEATERRHSDLAGLVDAEQRVASATCRELWA